jgi:ribosome biogenesis GTPase
MAKRQLNQRQAWRAKRIQQERIERSEKKVKKLEARLNATDLGIAEPGLVIPNYGNHLIAENETGHLFSCMARQNIGQVVCGDRIIWQRIGNEDSGVVTACTERHSLLERPTFNKVHKPVAANIDQVFIVSAPEPSLQTLLIDRYLVATEISELDAILLINKIDLLNNQQRQKLEQELKPYEEMGYKVIYISTKGNIGMAELQAALKGKISILSGQSGVGKSSTINYLMPDLALQVGALSEGSRLGKHTTSASRYFHLPFSGGIIDSPGVRDFGLWQFDEQLITHGFREFRPYIGQCKFSNCSHKHEPHCALREAVQDGHITQSRFDHFHQIIETNKTAT